MTDFDEFHATRMRCDKCANGVEELIDVKCLSLGRMTSKHNTCEEFKFRSPEDEMEFHRLLEAA